MSPPDSPPKKITVSENSSAAPIPVKTTKLTMAATATRFLAIRNAKTTNNAGVSLIAAARPISTPRRPRSRDPPRLRPDSGPDDRSGNRSATTSAISSVFTWP